MMIAPEHFGVRLLSEFRLERDGQPVRHFNANRPELLLMYMAVAPDTWHLRRSVAADIWPATDVSTARKHLSYNLFLLKKITAEYGLASPFEETRLAFGCTRSSAWTRRTSSRRSRRPAPRRRPTIACATSTPPSSATARGCCRPIASPG
ncbi:MAG: hypothetical protein U0470_07475 [Anaerolineae bacterium]